MRIIVFILAILLSQPAVTGTVAAAPRLAADGKTLVLEPAGKSASKKDGSGDTLYELLGQEVQVFIFNSKTRVWPKVYVRSGPSPGWSGRPGWGGRAAKFRTDPRVEPLIQKYGQAYGVDPSLVRAVVRHESGFNANAVSPKGAQGLMQLMPGTAALMGVQDPFDPEQNIAGGVGYLRRCLERFQHNVPLAVAAYNAGPERVAQCGGVPPIPETQTFVSNVMGTYGAPPDASTVPAAQTPKGSAAAPGPPAKIKGRKQAAASPVEASPDQPRRRPKAKIIEVRARKTRGNTATD